MPLTVKSASKGYLYNLNYELEPRQFASIIKVLETSRDNLNKPNVAHIVLQLENNTFNKSSINDMLKREIETKLNTGFGYFMALEHNETMGCHLHLMLTFSTGTKLAFTILKTATDSLLALDGVKSAMALPRKAVDTVVIEHHKDYFKYNNINNNNNYFHDLTNEVDFCDAVYRYSYLSKKNTKQVIKGFKNTQPKFPLSKKTKQGQKKRKEKREL